MKKITGCEYADKIEFSKQDKTLELHIAGCADCRQSQKISDWMRKFAVQTQPPQNLPAPGFLMFKARLLQKQSALNRVIQPIFWMQVIAVILFVGVSGWLLFKSKMPIGSIFKETFLSFLSITPLLIFGVISAVLICTAFVYILREKDFKK